MGLSKWAKVPFGRPNTVIFALTTIFLYSIKFIRVYLLRIQKRKSFVNLM